MNWGLEEVQLLHTNDALWFYCVCQNLMSIITPKCLDSLMAENLGKVHDLLHDSKELLPPTAFLPKN